VSSRAEIEQAVAALEAQRSILGDAVVDTALRGLREQLATLAQPTPPVDSATATTAPAPISDVGAGERRLVTILFADVVGSTSLGEALDAEDLTEILNGAFAAPWRMPVGTSRA
jgi:class 3 adenylate cyclase